MRFQVVSKLRPQGDQPQAIKKLVAGLKKGYQEQTLLGVTGSGKTFAVAHVIEKIQKPTLIISPNKTLAAQLFTEFRELFPHNAVHYFVSYYDYYQPEAYIPQSDTYIAKETDINEDIDRLRHASTQSLLTRSDTLIVASVSCIYGLGSPELYQEKACKFSRGKHISRQDFLRELIAIYYKRDDVEFTRGSFRVKGDTVEVHPATGDRILRFEFLGNTLEKITKFISEKTGQKVRRFRTLDDTVEEVHNVLIFPAKHYVTEKNRTGAILKQIREELRLRLRELKKNNKLVEAQRLEQRTSYDLEMIETTGYVNGIENYSRHFDGRKRGEPPYVLLNYFPKNFLTVIDESHIAIPQISGMYKGDRSRKQTLTDHGFRLPSALDNRPLTFMEFKKKIKQTIYTSATPRPYEYEHSKKVVEMVIRPTGLVDPVIEVRDSQSEVDDLIQEIEKAVKKHERTLVLTLTKRMAEELSDYLQEKNIKVEYLHASIDTLKRIEILKNLREKVYDVIVGINLLREGLDLPEVALVVILDADYQGFLRTPTTLIQIIGRAARHKKGRIIMYAHKKKPSEAMRIAITETDRRRKKQLAYNRKHKITPKTIEKPIYADIVQEAEDY